MLSRRVFGKRIHPRSTSQFLMIDIRRRWIAICWSVFVVMALPIGFYLKNIQIENGHILALGIMTLSMTWFLKRRYLDVRDYWQDRKLNQIRERWGVVGKTCTKRNREQVEHHTGWQSLYESLQRWTRYHRDPKVIRTSRSYYVYVAPVHH